MQKNAYTWPVMVLRYTLEQANFIGRNAAIILNLVHDLGTAQSTRQLARLSGLSDKTVTAALKKLRVVKLLHPEALYLLPLGKECSKITTACSKTTTPGQISAIPQSTYVFGVIEPEIKKGDKERGDYRGERIKGKDVTPSIATSIATSIGGKEVNQLGEKKKKKQNTPPTLEEVKTYFRDNNQTEKRAEEFYNWHERERKGRNGRTWQDSQGRPVKVWKTKARQVWFRDEPKTNRWDELGV